ncbi:MFS transporter [Actinomadura terrae]|uniref:MFS transporter n=1 Tax=Actinomadura terrae TaxID=604353 RepID=UPI001FA7592F|nr:MFS transporter [Actinomadura terrae]
MTRRDLAVLVLACAAQFMVVLDVSVVNVALPSLQADLGFDPVDLHWAVNAYALPFAGFLLLGGRLADLYGLRRAFVLGLALFTLAGLAGGLAGGQGTLIAARAVQGLGAAVLAPATLTVLSTTVGEDARPRALAAWTAAGLAGGTSGNLVGGVLTDAFSWRWVLLVNVPVGVLLVVPALRLLPAGRRNRRLDARGAVLATAGIASLTYGLAHAGAPSGGFVIVAGAVLVACFVALQTRERSPLLPVRLLRIREVAVGNAAMLLAGACLNPMWYFLALSMRDLLHFGALRTGLGFLPHTLLTIVVGLHLTPRLMRRTANRTLVAAGALVAASGFLWQSALTEDGGYLTGILGPAVLISLGGGLLNTPLTAAVTSGVPAEDAGAASGLTNTAKQVGGALGLAVLVTLGGYGAAFLAIAGVLVLTAAAALLLPGRAPDALAPNTAA